MRSFFSRITPEKRRELPFVIVRDFEKKPVKLRAFRFSHRVVEVFGEDSSRTIGFPVKDVYKFDTEFFNTIQNAFRGNDERELRLVWDRATPFVPVVN